MEMDMEIGDEKPGDEKPGDEIVCQKIQPRDRR